MAQPPQLSSLKPPSSSSEGHHLRVKVLELKEVVDRVRSDESRIRIGLAIVADASGAIVFTARDDQLDVLKPGETVEIRNGKIEMFQGFMRLEVDKWGKIVPSSTPLAEVNSAKNMSSVEYELVEQQ